MRQQRSPLNWSNKLLFQMGYAASSILNSQRSLTDASVMKCANGAQNENGQPSIFQSVIYAHPYYHTEQLDRSDTYAYVEIRTQSKSRVHHCSLGIDHELLCWTEEVSCADKIS